MEGGLTLYLHTYLIIFWMSRGEPRVLCSHSWRLRVHPPTLRVHSHVCIHLPWSVALHHSFCLLAIPHYIVARLHALARCFRHFRVSPFPFHLNLLCMTGSSSTPTSSSTSAAPDMSSSRSWRAGSAFRAFWLRCSRRTPLHDPRPTGGVRREAARGIP